MTSKFHLDLDVAITRALQAGMSPLTIADVLEQRADAERQRHATVARSSYVAAPATKIGAPKQKERAAPIKAPTLAKIAALIAGR